MPTMVAINSAAAMPASIRAYANGDTAATGTLEDPFQDCADGIGNLDGRVENVETALLSPVTLANANASLSGNVPEYHVPVITAARTYTFALAAPTNGNLRTRVVFVVGTPGTTPEAIIQRNGGTTLCQIDTQGWADFAWNGTDYVVSGFGGDVSTILAAN